MSKTVRFHEIGGPEVLRLDDLEPGEPGPGEVRIRVEAIGVNRAEILFRRDRYIEPVKHLPATLGTEAAGVVEALGPEVAGFAEGHAVSVLPGFFSQNDYGVYAEQAIVPAVRAPVPSRRGGRGHRCGRVDALPHGLRRHGGGGWDAGGRRGGDHRGVQQHRPGRDPHGQPRRGHADSRHPHPCQEPHG